MPSENDSVLFCLLLLLLLCIYSVTSNKLMNDCMELCRECECVELTASDSDAAVLCAVDIDECATLRGICINGRCRNTVGSFICLCQPGYYYNDERLICDGTYSQSRPCQLHSVRPSGSRHV